ncbi:hypothetical protein [Candidatus Methanomethylophilus sp. 1R26]|uniref:hypothetical protein n=1 Tax=Candidatus Methanomethylophilus sp. 1R26 TaxID=1769296 RepID=UPI001911112B|nr:hypothetical protein [Candidatus Methanomethylophilus sp. 1R26]
MNRMRADDDVMSDAVRLQKVNEVLDRLKALSVDHVLLIEGLKDRRALTPWAYTGICSRYSRREARPPPRSTCRSMEGKPSS